MKRLFLSTIALLALAGAARADVANWDFGQHPGLLGNSQIFSSGAFDLTARGFTGTDVGTALFSKTAAGDERGLGLNNDPTGNEEITGRNFIQLNLDGLLSRLSGFQFSMNSSTDGEAWSVFGSNDAHPFQFTLLASGTDEGLHNLAGGYDNYNFFYTGPQYGVGGANVLIGSFDAVAAVPEPSTWAMLLLGFVGVGVFGMRRRNAFRLV